MIEKILDRCKAYPNKPATETCHPILIQRPARVAKPIPINLQLKLTDVIFFRKHSAGCKAYPNKPAPETLLTLRCRLLLHGLQSLSQ